jgi:homocysteine S-methyltransferase
MAEALLAAPGVEQAPVQISVGEELPPREKAAPPEPVEEPSILDLVASGRKVIVTELDPPKTLDLERFYSGAQALRDAGSDAITLADNSLAILRVSNLAMGAVLKERFGITPLLHLSCRDRNVIGLQSELLGMAALGIRHVLPLTGDPAKVGDHPGATSVYDVTSIELLKIIAQLNTGLNANGKSIARDTQFVSGCTFNPGARNLDAQLSRLDRKIAAGATYVMTQPIFDPRLIEETARRTAGLGVPIFPGIWPLLNSRQAEFLHNEVPGIVIPERVRGLMSGLEGVEGRKRGISIAQDACRAALDHFPGVYLITPFLAFETTVELAQFVRTLGK